MLFDPTNSCSFMHRAEMCAALDAALCEPATRTIACALCIVFNWNAHNQVQMQSINICRMQFGCMCDECTLSEWFQNLVVLVEQHEWYRLASVHETTNISEVFAIKYSSNGLYSHFHFSLHFRSIDNDFSFSLILRQVFALHAHEWKLTRRFWTWFSLIETPSETLFAFELCILFSHIMNSEWMNARSFQSSRN